MKRMHNMRCVLSLRASKIRQVWCGCRCAKSKPLIHTCQELSLSTPPCPRPTLKRTQMGRSRQLAGAQSVQSFSAQSPQCRSIVSSEMDGCAASASENPISLSDVAHRRNASSSQDVQSQPVHSMLSTQ